MFKAVQKPKEYTVIKVPNDCKNVGLYVAQEAGQMDLPMDISTEYTTDGNQTSVNGWTVQPGDVIVIDTDDLSHGNSMHVLRPDEYARYFEEKPDSVSIDGGTVISGGKIDSEFRFQLSEHTYATIGPDGLAITDTGDGTVNMSELDRTIKALANALKRAGYWFGSANKDD